jgi:hypothetical protein
MYLHLMTILLKYTNDTTTNISEEDLRKMPKKSTSVVSFLKEKAEAEKTTRQEELALKKEELQLERDRFELERQERLQRLENERQHNKMLMDLLVRCLKK